MKEKNHVYKNLHHGSRIVYTVWCVVASMSIENAFDTSTKI